MNYDARNYGGKWVEREGSEPSTSEREWLRLKGWLAIVDKAVCVIYAQDGRIYSPSLESGAV